MYEPGDSIEAVAQDLIAQFHPELATIEMGYLFADKEMKSRGRPVYGKVSKASGKLEHYSTKTFIIEIPLQAWNDFDSHQRRALVDHLLCRCKVEEDEKTGEPKCSVVDPDVQEFSAVLRRYGVWHEALSDLVTVARSINFDDSSVLTEEHEDVISEE